MRDAKQVNSEIQYVEEKLRNTLIDAVLMDVKDVKPSIVLMLLQCFGFRTDICIIRVVRNYIKDNIKSKLFQRVTYKIMHLINMCCQ